MGFLLQRCFHRSLKVGSWLCLKVCPAIFRSATPFPWQPFSPRATDLVVLTLAHSSFHHKRQVGAGWGGGSLSLNELCNVDCVDFVAAHSFLLNLLNCFVFHDKAFNSINICLISCSLSLLLFRRHWVLILF